MVSDNRNIRSKMIEPQRIQRKRTKGFRLPEGTVSVCRPGRWGNPYPTAKKFEWTLKAILECQPPQCETAEIRHMIRIAENLNLLSGKNLACWCKVGEECHADVLIDLANQKEVSEIVTAWRITPTLESEWDSVIIPTKARAIAYGKLLIDFMLNKPDRTTPVEIDIREVTVKSSKIKEIVF